MSTPGGTENSGPGMVMRPSRRLAGTVPVLTLFGAHLFFSAVFTLALVLSPMLALVSVWTYATVLPFAFLAVLVFASRLDEMECLKIPAVLCVALAPFITWYIRTAGQSDYFAICLMVLCISVVWLLQSHNRFLELVFGRDGSSGDTVDAIISQALHLSYKSVIYFVIAPLCADLVGIIYKAKEAELVLPFILDNIAAHTPLPMACLHYAGLVFTLFFQSALALSMAYRIEVISKLPH
ncbi:MAG: hypothetical protein IJS15_09140 [Victivallales bacterium]|nr:hypothetical protein [Victivallales bacterium]